MVDSPARATPFSFFICAGCLSQFIHIFSHWFAHHFLLDISRCDFQRRGHLIFPRFSFKFIFQPIRYTTSTLSTCFFGCSARPLSTVFSPHPVWPWIKKNLASKRLFSRILRAWAHFSSANPIASFSHPHYFPLVAMDCLPDRPRSFNLQLLSASQPTERRTVPCRLVPDA